MRIIFLHSDAQSEKKVRSLGIESLKRNITFKSILQTSRLTRIMAQTVPVWWSLRASNLVEIFLGSIVQ